MTLTHGSLFSGYGGLDLAVEATLGARTLWHCEKDPAASLVLAHHWPDVPNLGDITAVDWSQVEPVDVLSGGFPCQGLSLAGRRAGLADPRSGLWSYFAAAIDALRPRYVLIENVRGLLSTKAGDPIPEDEEAPADDSTPVRDVGRDDLEDWSDGPPRALGVVLGELAELGYDSTWCGLPASRLGAPHPRFRVFLWGAPADAECDAVRLQPIAEPGGGGAPVAGLPGAHLAPDAGRDPRPQDHPHQPAPAGRGGNSPADADPAGRERAGRTGSAEVERRPAGAAAAGRGGHPAPADPESERRGQGRAEPTGQLRRPHPAERGSQAPADPDGLGLGSDQCDLRPGQSDPAGSGVSGLDWREWAPAVERWERLTGHPAPPPTIEGKRGGRRLNGALSEWMMGLPPGWITAVPGITNDDACRLAGNGVVPQQAAAAIPWLIETHHGREAAA